MTLTDQILEVTRGLAAGQGQRRDLVPLLVTAFQGIEAHLRQFQEFSDNPEFTPEMRGASLEALARLKECFELLQGRLDGALEPGWEEGADLLEEALENMREQQQRHLERIEGGPTSNVFLNRLLIHMDSWQRGQSPGASTLDLVCSLGTLEGQLDAQINGVKDEVLEERLEDILDSIMQICEDFAEAVRSRPKAPLKLATWQGRLVELSFQFDQVLAHQLEMEFSEGPTTLPVVNLLDVAILRYLNREIQGAAVEAACRQCLEVLRMQLPEQPDKALAGAAQELFAILARLEEMAYNADRHGLRQGRESLFQAAATLVQSWATLEDDVDVVHLEGLHVESQEDRLPGVLADLLALCRAYNAGRCARSQFEEGIEHFRQLIVRAEGLLGRSRDNPAPIERTRAALVALRQLEGQLQNFLGETGLEPLLQLEELFEAAGAQLKEL